MPVQVYLQVLLATFLWGSAFPLIRFVFTTYDLPPLGFAGARFTLAGLMILGVARLVPRLADMAPEAKDGHRKKTADWPRVLLISFLSTALFYGLFFCGMRLTSGSSGAVVDGASPLVAALLAHFFLRNDRLTPQKFLAVLIAVSGAAVTAFAKSPGNHAAVTAVSPIGCGLIMAGLVSSSSGTLLVITYRGRLPLLKLVGTQMAIGGSSLLLLSSLIENWTGVWGRLDAHFLLALVSLSTVSAVAFRIWYGLMRQYKVASIAVFSVMNSVWGVLLCIVFMGESVTKQLFAGLFLVVIGVVLANKDNSGHKRDIHSKAPVKDAVLSEL